MNDVIEKIVELRLKGLTFRKIANELNTSLGKVHYQWVKYQNNHPDILQQNKMLSNQNSIIEEKVFNHNIKFKTSRNCKLVILPQGSTSLYVYYQRGIMTRPILEQISGESWEQLKISLRIYEVTNILFNGNNSLGFLEFNNGFHEAYKSKFIDGLLPNKSYIAQIGYFLNGEFTAFCRSNPIQTPRNDSNQAGPLTNDVLNWKSGYVQKPNWIENFSAYSLYENN